MKKYISLLGCLCTSTEVYGGQWGTIPTKILGSGLELQCLLFPQKFQKYWIEYHKFLQCFHCWASQ